MTAAGMPANRPETDLRAILRVLRERLWVIILMAVIVGATVYVWSSRQDEVFESTAEVLVKNYTVQNVDPETGRADPRRALNNELKLARSDVIREQLREEFGPEVQTTVQGLEDADVIGFVAQAPRAATSAQAANRHAELYIEERTKDSLDRYDAARKSLEDQLDAVRQEREDLTAPLDQISQLLVTAEDDDVQKLQALLAARQSQIQGDLTRLSNEEASLVDSLNELNLTGELLQSDSATVTRVARPNTDPVEPQTERNLVLGILVGLVLGISLAYLLDYLDDSIVGDSDATAATGLPLLGAIPRVKSWRRRRRDTIAHLDEQPAAAEGYRRLRATIQILGVDEHAHTILFTSASGDEGKTTTAAGFALMTARAGVRTLLVSGDLRRPGVGDVFGLDPARGLTDVLVGDVTLAEAVHHVDENLGVLNSGPVPSNPAELLVSAAFRRLLEEMRTAYDVVVFDSPPVLAVADAQALAPQVDLVCFIVSSRKTSARAARRALAQLRQVDAHIAGVVVNRRKVKGRSERGYGYYASKPHRRVPTRKPKRSAPASVEPPLEVG